MSVSQYVFIPATRTPSFTAWQRVLDDAGSGLTLDEFVPADQAGYVPAVFAGDPSGFELYSGPTSEIDGLDLSELKECDRYFSFVTHSDLTEFKVASIAAAALAKLADGVYLGDAGPPYRKLDDVMVLAKEIDAETAAWDRARAEKDAAIARNRCPHCGAPCPSYRKNCKACGREVGGAAVE